MGQAIDSAVAQTYANTEIIVVNDGSNDKGATEQIAMSYGKKIRYYKKENDGVATALNFGIQKMTGDYFSWLSHDDLYEKTKIEDQVNYLNKLNREDVIVACNAKVLFASGIKKKEKIDENTFKFIDIFLSTSAKVGVNGCSLLIPKKAFDVCGNFDANLPVTQDYDLWFRIKDKFKFVLLDKFLVISRRHERQDSVLKHELMVDAGDQMHYDFLNTVSYERFEEYFSNNKSNIKHTLENYSLYKTRGYAQTASLILKHILRYYYENDIEKYNKLYYAEQKERTELKSKGEIGNQQIEVSTKSVNKISMLIPRLIDSIKRDGIYLSFEKAIRKAYLKVKNK